MFSGDSVLEKNLIKTFGEVNSFLQLIYTVIPKTLSPAANFSNTEAFEKKLLRLQPVLVQLSGCYIWCGDAGWRHWLGSSPSLSRPLGVDPVAQALPNSCSSTGSCSLIAGAHTLLWTFLLRETADQDGFPSLHYQCGCCGFGPKAWYDRSFLHQTPIHTFHTCLTYQLVLLISYSI